MNHLEVRPGDDWQGWEIDLLVSAYLELLDAENAGRHPVKADVNRELQGLLPARSRGSIEYKLQNVSAVLFDEHLPFIDGYKPARNYQRSLREFVLDRLSSRHALSEQLALYGSDATPLPPPRRLSDVLVEMPKSRARRGPSGMNLSQGEWGAIRDAQLRALGEAGERWVVELERAELREEGRPELAEQVEWVSKERGDGLGYDIASFRPTGEPTQIEVKTTKLGPRQPFYVTRRELAASTDLGASYHLYRVFDFAREPRLYVAAGSIRSSFALDPLVYEARPA